MGTPERAQQSMQRWMKWMADLDARGHLKDRGQPLEEHRQGRARPERGRRRARTRKRKTWSAATRSSKPGDIDQAAELSLGCPILAGGGSVEVRPVMKMDM